MESPIRVVIADDNQELANETRRGLVALGYEVVAVVFDGQQAVDACREARPDNAILDLEMPNLDGLTAAWQIINQVKIPVIILTVHEDHDLIVTAVEFGVLHYLLKPVTCMGLHAAIMVALRKKAHLKGVAQSLEEHDVIERAKRILVSRDHISEDEAYQALREGSGGRRAEVYARARSIVDAEAMLSVGAPPPAARAGGARGQDDPEKIRVFFSYSHKDKNLRDEIDTHLAGLKRQNLICSWYDGMIGPGEDWKEDLDARLEGSRLILLLISPDFIASDYCYDVEMRRAIERHDRGESIVIPIILRPSDWKKAPFGRLQALPGDARPVTEWRNRDKAFLEIAEGVRRAIERLSPPRGPAAAPPR